MIIEDLTPEHLRSIELRALDLEDMGDTLNETYIDYFMSSDFKKEVIKNGKVVMAMGGLIEGENCRTWLLGTTLMEKNQSQASAK